MAEITLVEAVTLALAHEMEVDPTVVVFGEDVGVNGGVFRATAGLQQKFGDDRVLDTPLAEVMIAGMCVGMASQGMKPVAEAQFEGFMYPMVDHIVNHAARLRHRTRGRMNCPVVFRAPWGGGIHAPEHHSDSNEATWAHFPGVRTVIRIRWCSWNPSASTAGSARKWKTRARNCRSTSASCCATAPT